jgi:hypothetical protein
MIDDETLQEMNGQYRMPVDAGPAWRATAKMGVDMSLIEINLALTPWERLLRNDSALALIRALPAARLNGNGSAD